MGYSHSFGFGGAILGILLIIIIILIIAAAVSGPRHYYHPPHFGNPDAHRTGALSVLNERYAKGEINKEELRTKEKGFNELKIGY